jgi:hypothetical protein
VGYFGAITLEALDTIASQLVIGPKLAVEISPILQQGSGEMALVPCTIKNLLCDQLGLSNAYVPERITTIFLNGKATNSIDEAMVRERSTIALIASMPGVVEATLWSGSFCVSMRSAIPCKEKARTCANSEGMAWVKLFNLLLTDFGPEFLKKGLSSSPLLCRIFFPDDRHSLAGVLNHKTIDRNPA